MKHLLILALTLFISFQSYGRPKSKNESIWLETLLYSLSYTPQFHTKLIRYPSIDASKILNDYEDKVSNNFVIPQYFYEAVNFWFSIYSQYDSSNVVIHDRLNLGLVYGVIDYSELKAAPLNPFSVANIQNKYTEKRIKQVKELLLALAQNSETKDEKAQALLMKIRFSGLTIPKNKSAQKEFFSNLAQNVRSQTGQRDMIRRGVVNAIPYFDFLDYSFRLFNLPHELIAISFLESSFNPKAMSKVDAAGIWQIMPSIGKKILGVSPTYDPRVSPVFATLGALHLLSQNYKILKQWDLSVTAYNSGTKHLLKAKALLKKSQLPLEEIFEKYEHPHLGFASKNFYAEFLALVHVLAYRDLIYSLREDESLKKIDFINHDKIDFYISLCSFNPAKIFDSFGAFNSQLILLNPHLKKLNDSYPRGTVLISHRSLSSKKFFKVPETALTKSYPATWGGKLIANKGCK